MCYLGDPFVHDLFVSYSHGDPDGRGSSPLKEWSRCLIRCLEEDIRVPWPEFDPLDIFLDEDLDPTLALTAELRMKVRAAGLLLVIMSERWLTSAWCKDEIGWFQEEVTKRGGINGAVVVVRAFPTNATKWPGCLKDERGHGLVGISFHPQPGGPGIQPFGWREEKPSQRHYWQALGELATTVINRLRVLKAHEELREVESKRTGQGIGGVPRLYLHARADRKNGWRKARKRLEEGGFMVEPAKLQQIGGSPFEIRRAQRERVDQLATCHGLLVLRVHPADDITADIENCHADRADVEARGRRLPCAVLDFAGGGEIPAASAFAMEVLPGRGPGWLVTVRAWLDRAYTAPAEVAA